MRLRDNAQVLRHAVHLLEGQRIPGASVTPAAQWLVDNIALVEEQLEQASDALPARYFRRLPVLTSGASINTPRVHDIAWSWLPRVQHAFDAPLLDAFFDGYQSVIEPTWGEWWALPSVMRMVLIEQLRRVGERVAADRASRSLANWVADDAAPLDEARLDAAMVALRARGAEQAFLLQLRLRWSDLAQDDTRRTWLARQWVDPVAARHEQQAAEAAHDADVSQAMRSLRAVARFEWRPWITQRSQLAQTLAKLPTFTAETQATQNRTLHAVEGWSQRSGVAEVTMAQALVDLTHSGVAVTPTGDASAVVPSAAIDPNAQAVGTLNITTTPAHWLEGAGQKALASSLGIADPGGTGVAAWWRRARLTFYLSCLALFTALAAAAVLPAGASWFWWLLVLGPASQVAVSALHRLIAEWVRPTTLPRLALTAGVPREHRVLVAVPCLLDKASTIDSLSVQLQRQHLAAHEPWAQYALLSDFADAPTQTAATDAPLLAHAQAVLGALNVQHAALPDGAPRFLLLHRQRQWSDSEQCWMGWERKRGKLEQLIEQMHGGEPKHFMPWPTLSTIADHTPYLLVLDSDTQLPPGALRALVGMAAHPANAPRLHPHQRRVAQGYGVIQPRVALPFPMPGAQTAFHWLFAGQPGLDPYNAASSEVYQDYFGEGSFAGKGLMHVAAAHAVLGGRLPNAQVLSHDLLEGALLRCAVASDVAVLEDAPYHPDVATARAHRWVRGDWQLLPFIAAPKRWSITGLNLWKMLDNLRRSLVAPGCVLLLLVSAWLGFLPFAAALLLVTAALGIGPFIGALADFAITDSRMALRPSLRHASLSMARAVGGTLWQLVQLLHDACVMVDAIVRALVRQAVTRRRLLAWTTAAAAAEVAHRRSARGAATMLMRHSGVSVLALLLAGGLVAGAVLGWAPWSLPGIALCTLWALSPWLTWLGSRRLPTPQEKPMSADIRDDLQDMARETWRYFDHMVTAEHHHLPPDNHQRLPQPQTAARTSPTNIGMHLLALLCARRLGFIGYQDMLHRLSLTLTTMESLPRHRGHFYNWYDTQTLAVLPPAYLSTVDSGNLSAALVAVASALRQHRSAKPGPNPTMPNDALDGTACDQAVQQVLQRDAARVAAAHRTGVLAPSAMGTLQVEEVQRRIAALDDHATLDGEPPSAAEQALWHVWDHLRTRQSLTLDATASMDAAAVERLAQRFDSLAWSADYAWLYDTRRELMHIGALHEPSLVVGESGHDKLDINHYDMLCSEARLASLVAIAKGDLPAQHWARLKRPSFAHGGDVGVQSWSGSMFEYLMPTLLVDEPAGSLLHAAAHVALTMQREQGSAWHLPWGVSESAHAERDASLAYQYGPQGVATLALRRTPPSERVIAPYATMLALPIAPRQAWANLRRLQHRGARDRYGFIEALDHTESRQQSSTTVRRVVTFMAHHQGMSLVAMTNALHGHAARQWFMANPLVAATLSLLQEPIPNAVKPRRPPPLHLGDANDGTPSMPARHLQPGTQGLEPVALLSNGRLSVMLRPDGAGATRWMGLAVSRWRDDALRGEHGSFVFLRTQAAGAAWHSLTQHPAPNEQADYRCEWQPHAATFDATGPHLHTRMRVWVAPEEDVELRDITIEHRGDGPALTVELASYFEVVLAAQAADEAHPAFSNLFVQARWDPDLRALWFTRVGRLAGDAPVHAVHFVSFSDGHIVSTRPTSDRTHALGRGGSVQAPRFAVQSDASNTGLDPVACIALRCELPQRGAVRLRFATAVASDPAALVQIIERHRQRVHVDRAWRMASTLAVIALREARVDAQAWHAWHMLSAPMAQMLSRTPRGSIDTDRRCLWRLGLSGERALLLVRVPESDGLLLADWVARVTPLWARAGLSVDVVLLDTEPSSYLQPVHDGLTRLVHAYSEAAAQPAHSACRLMLLRAQDLTPLELQTLRTTARLDLLADGRAPSAVMQELRRRHALDLERRQAQPSIDVRWLPHTSRAERAATPTFSADNGACRFPVGRGQRPQRAWSNVLANPTFGTHVTEAGGGHAWAHNSRLLQITPASNDALTDPAARWLLLQDLDSGHVWNAWPAPWGAADVTYRVEHGPGWTSTQHEHDGIEVTLQVCVDRDASVQQTLLHLRCTNAQAGPRRLRVIATAAWQLGARWADRWSVATAPHWCSGPTAEATLADDVTRTRSGLALMATQHDAGTGFAGTTAFLALRPADAQAAWAYDWTCDRRELYDARGHGTVPEAFGQRSGGAVDPCAALSLQLDVQPGRVVQVALLLGHADSVAAAQALAEAACAVDPNGRARQSVNAWRERLGRVQVQTPDPLFDALVNHWLPYQTLTCRVWARAGFYQVGGAYGFRDQLQDTMALTHVDGQFLREQILRCASRQFREGDVQHWWHPPEGAGVRTRFSDDLLWLAAALVRHLDTGGDAALLDAQVPWLEGSSVPDGAEDVYETPTASDDTATVYEHAARALDKSLTFGVHGLPLMGAGDWNDGMNRVGIEGRGESVWLAWFQVSLLEPMAVLADARQEPARAVHWRASRQALLRAIEAQGWDGQWYRRAFFDDGSPLGSSQNEECRIDLIAQAWSVLAGGGDPARAQQAMQSAVQHLVDEDAGLVRLLDPPLALQKPSAGYIQAYPRGVRENGGQYTHAAVWSAMAHAKLGDAAMAWQAWTMASPAHRLRHDAQFERYRLEPYAVAADVYGHEPRRGQGGWSWYTGAAGWLLRAGLESLLGLRQCGGRVCFTPLLPPAWPSAQLVVQHNGFDHVFTVTRQASGADQALAVGAWLDLNPLHANSRWTVVLAQEPPTTQATNTKHIGMVESGLSSYTSDRDPPTNAWHHGFDHAADDQQDQPS